MDTDLETLREKGRRDLASFEAFREKTGARVARRAVAQIGENRTPKPQEAQGPQIG